jgi:hypothetical protein
MLPGVGDLDGYGQTKQPSTAKRRCCQELEARDMQVRKRPASGWKETAMEKDGAASLGLFSKPMGKAFFYLFTRRKERTRLCIA